MSFHDLRIFFAGYLGWAPQWLTAVLVGLAIILGGLAVQWLVVWLVEHLAKRWDPLIQFIFIRGRRVIRFALVLVAVDIALPLMPLAVGVLNTARKVLLAAFIVLLGYLVYMAVDIAITRYVNALHMDQTDNLLARKSATQMRVLRRAINVLIFFITAGFALMSFDAVRQFGVSLFASAGVAGLAIGLAARPVLSNMIAGVQLALTQPIRLDDVVVVEGEWGRIEEFTSTYVVVRIWDLRRLIVPLSYFLEKPFRNWTYQASQLLGTVYLYTDYSVPVARVREKAIELIKAHPNWDGDVAGLVVTDVKEHTVELRALMSAADASKAFDLRCAIREQLLDFVQREYPQALPRTRAELSERGTREPAPALPPAGAALDDAPTGTEGSKQADAGASVPGISQPTPATEAEKGSKDVPDPERPPDLPPETKPDPTLDS